METIQEYGWVRFLQQHSAMGMIFEPGDEALAKPELTRFLLMRGIVELIDGVLMKESDESSLSIHEAMDQLRDSIFGTDVSVGTGTEV
jgi:hypothetical protein